jgi:hypothetical protein
MTYPITDIGIDADDIDKLKSVGIRTTAKLLEAAGPLKGRKTLSSRIGVSEKTLLRWANTADRMRIKGMGKEYAGLLQAAGVDTVKELRYRKPENLARAMADANARRKMVRFLPPKKLITRWVEQAKKLPLKISYKD